MRQGVNYSKTDARPTKRDGILLIVASFLFTGVMIFWMLVAKLLPPSGLPVFDWMRQDHYYCFLVPIVLIPMSLFANYLRWVSHSLTVGGGSRR